MATENSEVGIGLLGLGIVGSRLAKFVLDGNSDSGAFRNKSINLKSVLIRDPTKDRSLSLPTGMITTNPEDVILNPDISIIVEVIGGEYPAYDYIKRAIIAGKHVVTANKEVIAKHGPELSALATNNGVGLRFEASVGGGIPIISPMVNDLQANKIDSIRAIINGTTNFIMSKMSTENLDFSTALAQAQHLGLAEPDPTSDVEGIDAVYKLAILASLAFNTHIDPDNIFHEGITHIGAKDFQYAHELDYEIKLLAISKLEQNHTLQVRVHPVFLPFGSPLSKIEGSSNAIEIQGDLVNPVIFSGPGAGATPTISSILSDTASLVSLIHRQTQSQNIKEIYLKNQFSDNEKISISSISELETCYYMRVNVEDRGGVLAQIAMIMGNLNISIDSVLQKDSNRQAQTAELVITTHPSKELSVQKAVTQIRALECIKSFDNLIRIEGN
tara:strand:- start:10 stop:1341 length:1332 start_codon:yes stop_codon:yes gene_type:complete